MEVFQPKDMSDFFRYCRLFAITDLVKKAKQGQKIATKYRQPEATVQYRTFFVISNYILEIRVWINCVYDFWCTRTDRDRYLLRYRYSSNFLKNEIYFSGLANQIAVWYLIQGNLMMKFWPTVFICVKYDHKMNLHKPIFCCTINLQTVATK